MKPALFVCTSLLTCCAWNSAVSADPTTEFSPRLSVGITRGPGITQSELNESLQDIADLTGTTASGKYKINPAFNLEIPFAFRVYPANSHLYFTIAPTFLFSDNTNDFSASSGVLKITGDDHLTQIGGKLYAGLGLRASDQVRFELTPYIGVASLKSKNEWQFLNTASNARADVSESDSGSFTLYGATVGAYYSPEGAKSLELGARIGYAGGAGEIGDTDYQQNGVLLAVEAGLRF